MTKPAKTTKAQSPFERFQALTKALIAVPRKELQKKIEKYKAHKKSTPHHRRGIS